MSPSRVSVLVVALVAGSAAAEAPAGPSQASPPTPVAPEPASTPASSTPVAVEPKPEFSFGSYGRVSAASDLAGRSGRSVDVVRFGPRVDESSYAELQLTRGDRFGDATTRVVFTLALLGPFFHFDGQAADALAVRNLYLEAEHALVPKLALWAGSRIVRGDDVYLLDFWPLDNLNLVGGGARWALGDTIELAAHIGGYRLQDQYQYQVVSVPARFGVGTEQLELLDRPRTVGAAKVTWWPGGRHAPVGFKVVGYGEGHALPAGERRTATNQVEQLPSDGGFVAGAQLGAWHGPSRSFGNAFVRYSQGLGAYNPLESPIRPGTSTLRSDRAAELLVALVGNVERGPFGAQLGAYWREFRDAAASPFDRGATSEGVIALRPHLWLGPAAGIAAEASWQTLARSTLDDRTARPSRGSLLRFALMPYLTPAGWGSYTRPHLRLVYAVTLRDADALELYADEDTRSRQPVEQYLGLGAEWWFDSSYR